MGKKIFLSVVGGIAVCGLVLAIVGFAMGGRPGAFTVRSGQWVYYAGGESFPLFRLGDWWHRNSSGGTPPASASLISGDVEAPFAKGELKAVDIDIPAGYLVIKPGNAFGLAVDGPMQVTSSYKDGRWEVRSYLANVRTTSEAGHTRFWNAGADMTTTFTLTLPAQFGALDVRVGAGEAEISGFALETLTCAAEAGTLKVSNVTAASSTFNVAMGEIAVTGFKGQRCALACDLGSIRFAGEVGETLSANCDMGAITATLPRPASYGYSAEVGMGRIAVDGASVAAGLGGESAQNARARPFFELDCGMGSIEIKFS